MPRNNGVLCLKGTHVLARRRANRRLYVSLLFFAETELWPLLKWRNKVSKWGNKLENVSVLRLNKSPRGSSASMMMGSLLGFMRWKKLLVWCKCSFLSQTFKIYPPTPKSKWSPFILNPQLPHWNWFDKICKIIRVFNFASILHQLKSVGVCVFLGLCV